MSDRGEYAARVVRTADVDQATLDAWQRLEDRSLEDNAFLSPHFVMPAVRYLAPAHPARAPFLVLVERQGEGPGSLAGLGVFERRPPTRQLPLPHLRAYESEYAYRSGLLVDRDRAPEVLEAFFRFCCGPQASWHAITFDGWRRDGELETLAFEHARRRGARWFQWEEARRAVLTPRDGGDAHIARVLSAHRIRDLRQARQRLEKRGRVGWRAYQGIAVEPSAVERLLVLEHMGWKREQGTSLRSRPAHESFFKDVVEGFRQAGRVVLNELTVGDEVVASMCTIISGRTAFGFKLGWDPRYARESPGMINMLEFVRAVPGILESLDAIDSGSSEGSFVELLFSERWNLSSGAFSTTPLGRVVLAALEKLARPKRAARRLMHAVSAKLKGSGPVDGAHRHAPPAR